MFSSATRILVGFLTLTKCENIHNILDAMWIVKYSLNICSAIFISHYEKLTLPLVSR